ncbi:deoxycytidylate deaminase isoform X2 [Agelaius phoeniceus]|uniref:deoxycytidylate deaminase isoform X2 n=1 Tax=Agelaius phoeniceus TaxID=39638 RepID=UPI004054F1CB
MHSSAEKVEEGIPGVGVPRTAQPGEVAAVLKSVACTGCCVSVCAQIPTEPSCAGAPRQGTAIWPLAASWSGEGGKASTDRRFPRGWTGICLQGKYLILPERLQAVVTYHLSEASCKKREDYLEWPEYFMAVAFLSAQRSKDPSSQVGACIVNSENKIVGIGYNGMPNGCSDDVLPWTRTGANRLDTKYPYVCHAELNAIMNKNSADVKGCSMYVALFPCNECAKLIIQAGIKEVIFMSDKYHDTTEMTAARRMFDLAGIIYREFKPKCNKIIIDFDSINSRPSQKLL